jgi:hypothetical protein
MVLKANMIKKLPYIGKEFKISFDVFVSMFGNGFQSIIHFTKGGNGGAYGDRTPGVWMSGQRTLHVTTAANGQWNFGYTSKIVLPEKQWICVEISQNLLMTRHE